ncbi:WG repeat-containing protein [bacterium]|nr:WG repeat-containing protein [bacterium]
MRLTRRCACLATAVSLLSLLVSIHSLSAQESGPRLFPVQRNGRCGFIDSTGRVVIGLRFQQAQDFSEGLAPVRLDGKWGYIDRNGEIAIPPQFRLAYPFSDSLARVDTGADDFLRFIDHRGQVVLEVLAVQAWSWSGGLLPVQMELLGQGLKWGYLDKTGATVIAPAFDSAGPFSDGRAAVKSGDGWSVIDRAGRVIKAGFEQVTAFREGCALVLAGGKWGCIDTAGALVIPPRWDRLELFYEGLAAAALGGKCCYLGRDGRVALDLGEHPEMTVCYAFQDGLAPVMTAGGWGFIDRTGKLVIPAGYAEARSFSEGLAAVRVGDKWGFIDRTGRLVIEPRFAEPLRFAGGLAQERYLDRVGYVDKSGKYVWEVSR